jgi:hypothetical protein
MNDEQDSFPTKSEARLARLARFPIDRITPLNVPAHSLDEALQHDPFHVAGNPVSSRPESGIANCFPGLEMDHRNFDRRFFPGLVFEFQDTDDESLGGARLVAVDLTDPDLTGKLQTDLTNVNGSFKATDPWFLAFVEQEGISISMRGTDQVPLGGSVVWRLVRSLEPGAITIRIEKRGEMPNTQLQGTRRTYIKADGTLNEAFQPGELTQSLCSPWQHDFRDCSCLYWASNHPDIALPAEPATLRELERASDAEAAEADIMWLRRDRVPDANTLPLRVQAEDRPLELDYYEINQRWQELNFVLEGREVPAVYDPGAPCLVPPFSDVQVLASKLTELAGIELALALEYLYAMYSLGEEKATDNEMRQNISFAKHQILDVAVSEMRHLRWAIQIRWELHHAGMIEKLAAPEIAAAARVPEGKRKTRPTEMRLMSPDVLDSFIAAEEPSGGVEGLYASVFSTVRTYHHLPHIPQLVSQIIADGVSHYSRFREVRSLLAPHLREAKPIVRAVQTYDANDMRYKEVKNFCDEIRKKLQAAYANGDMEDAADIAEARSTMMKLHQECERLAQQNIGVPFEKFFQ